MKGSGVIGFRSVLGPVKTNWAANAGKADNRFAKSPELVAKEGFHGMQMGELVIVPSADYRFSGIYEASALQNSRPGVIA